MGTKNNPGEFDCYTKAEPDEPMFVLLARDLQAPTLVMIWAMDFWNIHKHTAENRQKYDEAMQCAHDMKQWRAEHHGST